MAKDKKKDLLNQGENELVIHQDVARMRGNLTITQSKGMYSILKRSFEQLQNDRDKTKFVISTDELLHDMSLDYKKGMGKNSKVKMIDKPLSELMVKTFVWGTKDNINKAIFMQEFSITNEKVTLVFSNYIRDRLEVMANALIINDFMTLQSFKSLYAHRLYQHIMSWKDKGELRLSIKDFREFLGVPNAKSYERMEILKQKVLNVAIKEINEKADFVLVYEQEKSGRSITHFVFKWVYKSVEKQEEIEVSKHEKRVKKSLNKHIKINNIFYKITDYQMAKFEDNYIAILSCEDIESNKEMKIKLTNFANLEEKISIAEDELKQEEEFLTVI
jgi:plasmid replication initiation protein